MRLSSIILAAGVLLGLSSTALADPGLCTAGAPCSPGIPVTGAGIPGTAPGMGPAGSGLPGGASPPQPMTIPRHYLGYRVMNMPYGRGLRFRCRRMRDEMHERASRIHWAEAHGQVSPEQAHAMLLADRRRLHQFCDRDEFRDRGEFQGPMQPRLDTYR